MRKPRLSIEVTGTLGAADYQWKIVHKGKQLAESETTYATADLADEAAEYAKVKLQEAMMLAAPPPELTASLKKAKEKKPRKVKDKPLNECRYSEVCECLENSIGQILMVTIGQAGENFERLRKAAETIENVRKDLSEIE